MHIDHHPVGGGFVDVHQLRSVGTVQPGYLNGAHDSPFNMRQVIKARAAVLLEAGQDLQLTDIELRDPVG